MSAEKNIFNINIPKDEIPNCWKDENRLNVLFAPFRDKSVNSVEWDSKYSDWKQLINLYASHNKILTFTLLDLEKALIHNKRPPSGLKTVLDEMKREGIIQYEEDFLKKTSETWSSWMTDTFVKSPIRWSLNKIKNTLTNPSNTYVHVLTIQEEGRTLLNKIPQEYRQKVMDIQQLSQLFNDTDMTYSNLELILHNLNCQKKVALRLYNKEKSAERLLLIKVNSISIEDKEINMYILEKCEERLRNEIEKIETKNTALIVDAKKYLTKGNRNMAKLNLKRKNENEARILKKYNALHNIQNLLSNLQDAEMNLVIKGTYKKALDSLSDINKKLSLDEIDDIMNNIEETMNDNNDINRALGEPVDVFNDNISDSELEKELAGLIAEDEAQNIVTENLADIEEKISELKLPDDELKLPDVTPNEVPII